MRSWTLDNIGKLLSLSRLPCTHLEKKEADWNDFQGSFQSQKSYEFLVICTCSEEEEKIRILNNPQLKMKFSFLTPGIIIEIQRLQLSIMYFLQLIFPALYEENKMS